MKKKILLVDDDRVLLKFARGLLEKEGYEVATAQDGFAALNLLTSFCPGIMFFDLIMPKIDGDKLCHIVRKMPHLKDCYLVILSAAVAELDFDHTEIGADAYIAKGPFDVMGKHILAAIEASEVPRKDDAPKPIKGLENVYARQLTKELLSRNHHLETILESMAEGILEVFSDKVVYANASAVEMFGLDKGNLLASYPPDLFDGSVRNKLGAILKSGDERQFEIGAKNPLELGGRLVTISCIPVKGEPLTTILLITDVTERRQLEMRLQHVQKMEAIGTIAAGVAHNFRNTLTEVLVNTQVIQMNNQENSDITDVTERISQSVKRGAGLVDGLLQFSRKQMAKEFSTVDLVEVIKETYELIKKSFEKKIDIQIDLPDSLPILGDYASLSQSMMNLCNNARDAMPAGGQLRIQGKRIGNHAELIIADNGKGMNRKTIEQCFDPFFTTKPIGKGTGLGLSTTYGIIKSHDGLIHIESKPKKGTTVIMTFPQVDGGAEIEEKSQSVTEIVYGNGETILVVDDEKEILKAMQNLLNSLGYESSVAISGQEAIEKYQNTKPEIVLLDINMPEMDGVNCAEKILDLNPAAKIAFITGYEPGSLDEFNDRIKNAVTTFLTKPVELADLSTTLSRMLQQ
ncbi:MAG: response regulator [Desulfobacterales bacterium]|jgi:signal transduction histidine kinase/DNA-binding response OmpR family regulator